MKKIKTLWFVVDHDEMLLSFDAKAERGEQFRSERAAQRRAVELSQAEPGKMFMICKVTHVCSAAVGPSVTARVGS
jgi:hypothetical protein